MTPIVIDEMSRLEDTLWTVAKRRYAIRYERGSAQSERVTCRDTPSLTH